MPFVPPSTDLNFLDLLSSRVESLSESFRKLSRFPALKDLGLPLVKTVKEIFPAASVDLAYCPGDSQQWDVIIRSETKVEDSLSLLSKGTQRGFCEVHRTAEILIVSQSLFDLSVVAIVLSGKDSEKAYTDIDVVSVRLLIHLFENAYQDMLYRRNEKGLIFSLNHRILQLNSLIDTGIEVAALDNNAFPHRLALERAASLTNASKGVVKVTRNDELREEFFFPEGKPITSPGESSLSVCANFVFAGDTYSFELFQKESRSGIVSFEDTDQLLLDALTRQVHASLENRFLLEQALENERIEKEMNVAASIQQKIIPVSLPMIPGYDLAGKNIPSKSVGGDYYDCIPLRDGKYCLIVADVSGKGVPAALLVSSLHAYLSAYLEGSYTVSQLTGKLNNALDRASTSDKFVTAFLGLLSPATGEIECVNAGHNPGYVLRNDGTVHELKRGGLPLGILDLGVPYESESIIINKGERLLLYSDGVTEAENEQHVLYEQRTPLPDFLVSNTPDKAEAFISDLIIDVRKFTGSAPQNDDITALYLYRQP